MEGAVKKNEIFELQTTKIVFQKYSPILQNSKKVSNKIPNFCTDEHQETNFGEGS